MNILHVFVGGDNEICGVQECLYLLCKYLDRNCFRHFVWSPYSWTSGLDRLRTDNLLAAYSCTSDPEEFISFLAQNDIDLAIIHSSALNPLYPKGCIGALSEIENLPLVEVMHRSMLSQVAPYRVDRIIAVSDYVASVQQAEYKHLLCTIHNGIELDAFCPSACDRSKSRKYFNIHEDATVIGFLGRLAEEKGIEDILAIAPHISRLLGDTCFVFGGDGPLRGQLEKKAEELSVNARFYGAISSEKKASFLATMDVFIFPSRSEAFSVSVIEALAMCLPIIAYDQGPMREYFSSGTDTYFLVPANNQILLGETIIRILGDDSERNSLSELSCRESKRFSHLAMVDNYKKVLLDVKAVYDKTKPATKLTWPIYRYMGNIALLLNQQERALQYFNTAARGDSNQEVLIRKDVASFKSYVQQYADYLSAQKG